MLRETRRELCLQPNPVRPSRQPFFASSMSWSITGNSVEGLGQPRRGCNPTTTPRQGNRFGLTGWARVGEM